MKMIKNKYPGCYVFRWDAEGCQWDEIGDQWKPDSPWLHFAVWISDVEDDVEDSVQEEVVRVVYAPNMNKIAGFRDIAKIVRPKDGGPKNKNNKK